MENINILGSFLDFPESHGNDFGDMHYLRFKSHFSVGKQLGPHNAPMIGSSTYELDSTRDAVTTTMPTTNGPSWIILVGADCFRPLKIPVEVSLKMLGFSRLIKLKR